VGWLDRQSISTRLNLIMLALLVLLLAIGFSLSYVRNRSLITKVVINNCRILAGEVINVMELPGSPVSEDGIPSSHDPVRLQRMLNDITLRDPYRIRIVSLTGRHPLFAPSTVEREELQKLTAEGGTETFTETAAADENILLYARPLRLDAECLVCHGNPDAAPPEMRRRFPPGSPVYGHRRGEVMGAVVIAVATREISDEVWRDMRSDMVFRIVIFLVLIAAVTAKISRNVIRPIEEITGRMLQVAETGQFRPVALHGVGVELQRLANALNDMMEELARRDEQHAEAEKRFLTIVEQVNEGVITFLRDGKIVMANRRIEKLSGIPQEILPGMSFFDLLVQGETLREQLPAICSLEVNGDMKRSSHLLKRSDGTTIAVTVAVASSDCSRNLFTAILWEKDEHHGLY
jgi:PAS domain S-box-containing protein